MDDGRNRHFGTVRQNDSICKAVLIGEYDRLLGLLHIEATAEFELIDIVSADVNLEKDDRLSGIFSLANDCVAIDGTIHNETVLDNKVSVFDVYIHNGADFFSITSEDLPAKPGIDTRIRIVGRGLHVYPTFT